MPIPPSNMDYLLRLMVDVDGIAVVLTDVNGVITWWSRGAEKIFSRSAEQAVGHPMESIFTPTDVSVGIPQFERNVSASSGFSQDDRLHARADGATFWASGILLPLRDRDNTLLGFAKIIRDRTDVLGQLQTLRDRADTLDSKVKKQDIFISTLAHELRNPLMPLLNALQILRTIASDRTDVQYWVEMLARQVSTMRRLVEDVLDVARLGTNKISLAMETQSLRTILTHAAEAVMPLVQEKKQHLELITADAPLLVNCDSARLHQVFTNLLTNAVKYTPEGGRIWLKAAPADKEALVQVEDTGIGIAHSLLPRIFDLFTQAHSSQSSGGLGIGLYVVRDLVTLHGGSVQVRSDGPGKGSSFAVRLPLVGET